MTVGAHDGDVFLLLIPLGISRGSERILRWGGDGNIEGRLLRKERPRSSMPKAFGGRDSTAVVI